jgi:hypothetical protein
LTADRTVALQTRRPAAGEVSESDHPICPFIAAHSHVVKLFVSPGEHDPVCGQSAPGSRQVLFSSASKILLSLVAYALLKQA